jgi:hypothetical protein
MIDRHVLALFIPIIALGIPAAAIVMNGLQKVWRLRIEEARLRFEGEGSGEVQRLREDLDAVRRELSELNERVDFAERLLARGRGPDAST